MYFSIGICSCPMDHLHLVGLFTTRLPVFRQKARGYYWSLVLWLWDKSTNGRLQCSKENYWFTSGSGYFASLGSNFSQIFWQFVSVKVKILSKTHYWRQGILKGKRPHFRLMCVAQKCLSLSSFVYCYNVGCKAHSLSYDSYKRRRSHQK